MRDACSNQLKKTPANTGTEKLSSSKAEPTNSLNAPASAAMMTPWADLAVKPPQQSWSQECITTERAQTINAAPLPARDLPFRNRKLGNFHMVPTLMDIRRSAIYVTRCFIGENACAIVSKNEFVCLCPCWRIYMKVSVSYVCVHKCATKMFYIAMITRPATGLPGQLQDRRETEIALQFDARVSMTWNHKVRSQVGSRRPRG